MSQISLGLWWSKGQPNRGIEAIRTLDGSEVQAMTEASAALESYVNKPTFVVQSENYRSVYEAIREVLTRTQTFGPGRSNQTRIAEIGSRMSIWLQASRMVRDQTEAELKRSFGRRSPELRDWSALVQRLENEERGFLLLPMVRNYLHSRPIPVAATLSSSLSSDDAQVETSSTLELEESSLRKDRKLNRWLSENPRSLDGGLDLLPLVESMQRATEQLKLFMLRMELPKALEAADLLRRFAEEAFEGVDRVYSWPVLLSDDGTGDGDDWSSQVTFLPLELLEYLPESESFTDLRIPGSRGEEVVGPSGVLARLSYLSFNTRITMSTRSGVVEGDAHIWSSRTGPGWGAVAYLEGPADPGAVQIYTEEGHRARATLDSLSWHSMGGDQLLLVGILIGHGVAPPHTQLTHPYRTSNQESTGSG